MRSWDEVVVSVSRGVGSAGNLGKERPARAGHTAARLRADLEPETWGCLRVVGGEAIMPEQSQGAIVGVEGEVKWFDARKGFGFIAGPQDQDVFVHFSVIDGSGYRQLRDGSTVEYDAHKTDKGWKATRVVCRAEVNTPRRSRTRRGPSG